MGERQDDGGAAYGRRRRVHPGGSASEGTGIESGDLGIEELLAVVLRDAGDGGGEGELLAVAAFREARDAGAHRARTRRRDDWRPREQRRAGRSVKATLSVVVAGLALGGVAVAAIGSAGDSSHEGSGSGSGRPRTSASAPERQPGADSSAPSTGATTDDRPVTAQDTEAHCRAYQQVAGRGKALDSTAWQRLVEAAGGEEKVASYCAEQLAASASASPGNAGKGQGEGQGQGQNENAAGGNDNANSGGANSGAAQDKGESAKGKNE